MKSYICSLSVCFLLLGNTVSIQGQRQTRAPLFDAYITKYKALAIKQQKEYKIPASITLAQGLLESAAGNSRLARLANNHFGIKCKENWTGGTIRHDDDAKNECFRAYKTAEESYLDHSLFLAKRKYYVSLFDLDIYDYKAWAIGLQKCGYATDKSYGEKLIRIIETYQLYKYDKVSVPNNNAYTENDIYEIKISETEHKKTTRPAVTNWRRRIHKTNGIHFITAQENDSFDIIAYDTRMKLKVLLKYNETEKDRKLKEGDIVYLQPKKKYASKESKTHIVTSGESMYSISQLYGMRLKTLYKLNKLKTDFVPKRGDIIKVRK
ncbi:MAG: glucosaminidase domain-containing protein [Tannerella sp.]|nr:glucosaminidase domain-containing protein [Tannerella sp.]